MFFFQFSHFFHGTVGNLYKIVFLPESYTNLVDHASGNYFSYAFGNHSNVWGEFSEYPTFSHLRRKVLFILTTLRNRQFFFHNKNLIFIKSPAKHTMAPHHRFSLHFTRLAKMRNKATSSPPCLSHRIVNPHHKRLDKSNTCKPKSDKLLAIPISLGCKDFL